MEKTIITFSANEQKLQKTGGIDCYASNTVAYIEARFDLGENWSGYDSVRAVWWNDYNKTVATVLDSDESCIVPYEVLTRKGAVKVNLVGSIAENDVLTDRLTTCPVIALTIKCNAKTDGDNTQPITPSEYEQFVGIVKADADRAEDAKDSARVYAGNALSSAQNALASETNASTSETNAHTSEVNAKASELNAETYKDQAQTYAQNADISATNAENAKDEAIDARDEIRNMSATATTLPAGSSATALYSDGLLSLGIPKGDKGDKGNTGDTGAPAGFGTVSATVDDSIGTPSVEVTASGADTAKNFAFAFHNLKGEKGDKGDTGEVSQAEFDEAITNLKSELSDIGTRSINKFNKDTITNNTTFYSNGGTGSSTTHFISDYIPVDANLMYLYPRVVNKIARVFGYDSSKANPTAITISDYTINTTGFAYIRFSALQTELNNIMVSNSYATSYYAYGYQKAITADTLDSGIDTYATPSFKNNGLLYLNDWDNRIYYQGQGIWGNTQKRIGTQNTHVPAQDLIASVEDGYQISAVFFNSTTPSASAEISHTGWETPIVLPKNVPFVMNCRQSSNANISPSTGGFNPYITILPYVESLEFSNYVKGKKIDLSYQGYDYKRVGGNLPSPSDIATGLTARQDFAMYNGVMFQLYSSDYVALIDPVTGNAIASYPIDCGHGNSCQFSNEFYDPDDDYPLLYCFGYTDNFVYVNRVTDSDATLIRKYKLDTNGYRFSGGYDAQNNRIISIHYSQNSSTVETNNNCIITVWDLNNTTIDANGDYIPTIKKQTTIPFLPIIQGCEVFKGNLYVISGLMPSYNVPVKITAFDEDGNIITAIDNFPSLISNSEGEGISFFIDGSSYKCYFTTLFLYELLLE